MIGRQKCSTKTDSPGIRLRDNQVGMSRVDLDSESSPYKRGHFEQVT